MLSMLLVLAAYLSCCVAEEEFHCQCRCVLVMRHGERIFNKCLYKKSNCVGRILQTVCLLFILYTYLLRSLAFIQPLATVKNCSSQQHLFLACYLGCCWLALFWACCGTSYQVMLNTRSYGTGCQASVFGAVHSHLSILVSYMAGQSFYCISTWAALQSKKSATFVCDKYCLQRDGTTFERQKQKPKEDNLTLLLR